MKQVPEDQAMTKTAFPFADFGKMMGDMKMPTMDMGALVAIQQKNFEAVTTVNQLAMDSVRAVIERQVQIAQAAVEEAQTSIKTLNTSGAKVDIDAQTTAAKAAIEKAVANVKELSEMISKSQTEIFDVLNKRMMDGIEEVKTQFKLN